MALMEAVKSIKKCECCKIIFSFISKSPHVRKYCSESCKMRAYYLRDINKIRERGKVSAKKNRWKRTENAREYRNRERLKVRCRSSTLSLIKENPNKVIIEYKCRNCLVNNDLEIHHDEYPQGRKKIKKAIKEGKIYYLCQAHHKELTYNEFLSNRKITFYENTVLL